MKFYTWLKKQKDRNDKTGDVAKDFVKNLKLRPKPINRDFMLWHGGDFETFKILTEAFDEFKALRDEQQKAKVAK